MYTYTLKASKKKLPLEERTIIKSGISHEFTLKKVLEHKAELEKMRKEGKAERDFKATATQAYMASKHGSFLKTFELSKERVKDLAKFFTDLNEVYTIDGSLEEIENELKEYDKEIDEIKKQIGHEA